MDPAGSGLYPVDSGKAHKGDGTARVTRISWLRRDSLPSVIEISGKDCQFVTRLRVIQLNLMRPHKQVHETTPASGTTVGGVPPSRVTVRARG